MGEVAALKSYLERLSTRELVKRAGDAGIDLPPDLDRIFIIRELLDDAFEEDPPEPLEEQPELKTAQLPRQYHISFLEVLPRDPRWVFVFWEIKAQDRAHYESLPDFEGYALRALEYGKGKAEESFTVPVGPGDTSWYLGFPPGGGSFRIALWLRGIETALILSRPFTLPRFLNSPGNREFLDRPLVRLSGAEDFAILRDVDRLSRRRP